MDKTEVNMNVLNKVIAFKLLRILRDNGFIEDTFEGFEKFIRGEK